jgi:hypothetical protein
MNFGWCNLFIGKLGPNAVRMEPAQWPTNERAEYPEQNRDTTLPGINFNFFSEIRLIASFRQPNLFIIIKLVLLTTITLPFSWQNIYIQYALIGEHTLFYL